MPSKFSIDGRLKDGLDRCGMPVSEFAKVAALENIRYASKTVLNEAFRDVKPLQPDTALSLWQLFQEIEGMCHGFRPYILNLVNGEQVHQWLVARRNSELVAYVLDLVKPSGEEQQP